MALSSLSQARARRRISRRGFTLVELMVAITGGLAVSIVVFALAKDGSRFYKNESAVADATLSTTIGFERLRSDIARAGFMSTPNIFRDPMFCGNTSTIAAWGNEVSLLRNLSSLQVSDDFTSTIGKSATDTIDVQQILLSGAYESVERFPAIDVQPEGGSSGGYVVTLQTEIGALARMRFSTTVDKTALLARLFPPNRALRLVSDTGRYQFGRIAEAKIDTDGAAVIILGSEAPLVLPGGSANPCSVRGTGTLVNVVNFIRYRLDASHDYPTDYSALFLSEGVGPWETNRRELVREELGVDGSVLSAEIIAEYAVDLRFGITTVRNPPATGPATVLETFPIGVADTATILAPVVLASAQRPELVRAVRVRLGVRARDPDRNANVKVYPAADDVAPGLYRIYLGTEAGRDRYARVRTLQSDVIIPAHQEVAW
jgi:hypothetical protein